ncbi:hypothetical protein LguiA_015455 [Lonicera macranthoides]
MLKNFLYSKFNNLKKNFGVFKMVNRWAYEWRAEASLSSSSSPSSSLRPQKRKGFDGARDARMRGRSVSHETSVEALLKTSSAVTKAKNVMKKKSVVTIDLDFNDRPPPIFESNQITNLPEILKLCTMHLVNNLIPPNIHAKDPVDNNYNNQIVAANDSQSELTKLRLVPDQYGHLADRSVGTKVLETLVPDRYGLLDGNKTYPSGFLTGHDPDRASLRRVFLSSGQEGRDVVSQLEIIDVVQRLGISYHFEDEIDGMLKSIYVNYNNKMNFIIDHDDHKEKKERNQLYVAALQFRLLREHGFFVLPQVSRYV